MAARVAVCGILFTFLVLAYCNEGKHYYFVPLYHKTHWGFQIEIAKELHDRGNRITFHLPLEFEGSGEIPSNDTLDFASVLLTPVGYSPQYMQHALKELSQTSVKDFQKLASFSWDFVSTTAEGSAHLLRDIIKYEESVEHIDVLVGDISPALMGACAVLGDKYGTTCFYTSPLLRRNPDSEMYLGKGGLPSWFPASSVGAGIARTLPERLSQQLLVSISKSFGVAFFPLMFGPVKEIVKEYHVDPAKILSVHPILINTFQGLDWNIPVPSHVRFIGPVNLEYIENARDKYIAKHIRHLTNATTPEESYDAVDQYLDANENVIVVSFGKSVELSVAQIQEIVLFAKEIAPIAVLWTLRERHLHMLPDEIPNNLRIETWVNLIGVLSHEHTNLLISQCGVGTAHESILTQTPVLCIPFVYDQFDISVIVQYHNLGDKLDKEDMTASSLHAKVVEMIPKKKQYQQSAATILKIAKLKPTLSSVVDWIETIAEIGEQYVLPPVDINRISFYEYHELFYLILILIPISIPFAFKCCRCCCYKKQNNKIKKE